MHPAENGKKVLIDVNINATESLKIYQDTLKCIAPMTLHAIARRK